MRFSICNLGCKVNAYEAESIASLLEKKGWQRVPFEDEADAALIFTCAVTNTAAAKSRKMMHRVKRGNPEAVCVMVGCYAQINDGEPVGTRYEYSVGQYADYLLGNAKEDGTEEQKEYFRAKPLVEKMLQYGACAKEYFAKTSAIDPLGDVTIDEKFASFENLLPDDYFAGSTLSLKSQTTLSLYFNDTEELTFTCTDENDKIRTVETVQNDSYQVARIRNIAAGELQNSFTLTIKKGETKIGNITYSPMNYCYKVLHGGTTDARLQNVVKALAAYSEAAKLYFGS